MNNTTYTFKGIEVNGRTFDVGVFISYYWESNDWCDESERLEQLKDKYPVAEDFSLTDIYEQLPGGNQIILSWDDPIRFDILEAIDYRLDEALVGLTKKQDE